MMNEMQSEKIYVGIDVSKDSLDVGYYPNGKGFSTPNNKQGISLLETKLKDINPTLIVVEATGGYEQEVFKCLSSEGLAIVLVNPRQVRNFAKAIGQLAKTDRIDGYILARYAEAVKPEVRMIKNDSLSLLDDLLARRQQIIEIATSEKNRHQQVNNEMIKAHIFEHLTWLEAQVKNLELQIKNLVKEQKTLAKKDEIIQSIPGVGQISSMVMIANLPELGSLDRKSISALVGVAPFNKDSGKYKGKRSVWGGRKNVRNALYMATFNAVRYNSTIRVFFDRLIAKGKPYKVAIVACMRKLLTIINIMIKEEATWCSNKLLDN